MSTATQRNGGAPNWGDQVEQWAAEHLGIELEDATYYDGRTSDGTAVQIKGCRRWVGEAHPRRGRWTLWSASLVHLLADDGLYLLVVYDESQSPTSYRFADHYAFLTAEQVGRLARDRWGAGYRPSKGNQAKLPWREVFDAER